MNRQEQESKTVCGGLSRPLGKKTMEHNRSKGMFGRIIGLTYALFNYLSAILVLGYGIFWYANLYVPVTIDSGAKVSLTTALLVNTLLMLFFAVQHTIQARPWFKKLFIKCTHKSIERSTYVLFSNIAFVLFYLFWKDTGGHIWQVENKIGVIILWSLYGAGWMLAFAAIFLKNHFHFLGIRQAFLHFQNKDFSQEPLVKFFIYSLVRHPMYLGFLMAYWATPIMSTGHFIFALEMTIYTFIGIQFEEKMLIGFIGRKYRDYQKKVPMLIPFTR